MNGHLRSHGKHMLIGGVVVVALLMALGVSWQQAATWGVVLACPLGMLVMMRFMGRRESGERQHGDQESQDLPRQRRTEPFPPERRFGAR